jgi:hypothetical protein
MVLVEGYMIKLIKLYHATYNYIILLIAYQLMISGIKSWLLQSRLIFPNTLYIPLKQTFALAMVSYMWGSK